MQISLNEELEKHINASSINITTQVKQNSNSQLQTQSSEQPSSVNQENFNSQGNAIEENTNFSQNISSLQNQSQIKDKTKRQRFINIFQNKNHYSSIPISIGMTLQNVINQISIPYDMKIVKYQLFTPDSIVVAIEPTAELLSCMPQVEYFNLQLEVVQVQITTGMRIKQTMNQVKVMNNFTFFIDNDGEFIVYKCHSPISACGCLTKELSQNKYKIQSQDLIWTQLQKLKIAEVSDYGFVVEWENGNISTIRFRQL